MYNVLVCFKLGVGVELRALNNLSFLVMFRVFAFSICVFFYMRSLIFRLDNYACIASFSTSWSFVYYYWTHPAPPDPPSVASKVTCMILFCLWTIPAIVSLLEIYKRSLLSHHPDKRFVNVLPFPLMSRVSAYL